MRIKLEVPLIRALKFYADYIHSSQEWVVVNESLRFTFTKDDGFQQWLQTHHADAADGLSSRGNARRRRVGLPCKQQGDTDHGEQVDRVTRQQRTRGVS